MLTGLYAQARFALRGTGEKAAESIADARGEDVGDRLPLNGSEEDAFQLFAAAARADSDYATLADDGLRRCWQTLGGVDEAKARGFLQRSSWS